MAVRTSEAQGRRQVAGSFGRKAGSEGSVEQNRDATDRNPIRGRPDRTSGLLTAKSIAIKGRGGRSGACAAKAIELTSGGLRRASATGLRESQGSLTAAQKSAAGIVAGRSGISRGGR